MEKLLDETIEICPACSDSLTVDKLTCLTCCQQFHIRCFNVDLDVYYACLGSNQQIALNISLPQNSEPVKTNTLAKEYLPTISDSVNTGVTLHTPIISTIQSSPSIPLNTNPAKQQVMPDRLQDPSSKLKDLRQLEQRLKKKEKQLKIKETMMNIDLKDKEKIIERLFKAENRNFELEQTIKTLKRRISIIEVQPTQQVKETNSQRQSNCTQSSTDELVIGVRDKVTRFFLSKIDNELDKLLSNNDQTKDNPAVVTDFVEPISNNQKVDQPIHEIMKTSL
ncbi:Hypothetical predicted protein [Mytilus galloprovincialis]|uniref:Zinc finger PHD-type domain-containing protein n=1 Tax=Mytilus galloprovincialis TaxID=29158 RepID=A0A8B6C9K8_MYTGA|nr:Hypothetical predicted protein [Mytilus galloprovincialis]